MMESLAGRFRVSGEHTKRRETVIMVAEEKVEASVARRLRAPPKALMP